MGEQDSVAWAIDHTCIPQVPTASVTPPPPVPDSRYIRGSLYSVTDCNPFPEPLVIFEAVGLKSVGHVQGPQAIAPSINSAGISCHHKSETHSPGCRHQPVFLSLQASPQVGLLCAWLGFQHKRIGSLSPSPLVTFMARILLSLSLSLVWCVYVHMCIHTSKCTCACWHVEARRQLWESSLKAQPTSFVLVKIPH